MMIEAKHPDERPSTIGAAMFIPGCLVLGIGIGLILNELFLYTTLCLAAGIAIFAMFRMLLWQKNI